MPVRRQRLVDARPVGAAHEQIEILGVADQAGVMLERVGAADQIRNPGFAQMPDDGAVDIAGADVVRSMQDGLAHARGNAKPVPAGVTADAAA